MIFFFGIYKVFLVTKTIPGSQTHPRHDSRRTGFLQEKIFTISQKQIFSHYIIQLYIDFSMFNYSIYCLIRSLTFPESSLPILSKPNNKICPFNSHQKAGLYIVHFDYFYLLGTETGICSCASCPGTWPRSSQRSKLNYDIVSLLFTMFLS